VRTSGIVYQRSLFPLAVFIFILLILLPVPVFAQGTVDLTFGETGMFPWSITGILPGDHGSSFIDLHNNGTENGIVYIWVDNISMYDRHGNPGGGIANYMYFNISQHHLNSTVILPARINSFPKAPLLPDDFIIIESFNAGDTIRLNWTWEFEETGQPQNDAQNNTLRFDLSYTLVNLTTPLIPTPVPTMIPPGTSTGKNVMPQGPSLFEAGGIPGLNPAQRPQLRAPTEEPPEIEPQQPKLPDHGQIMILAFIILAIAVALHSQRKMHPEWKGPAEVLLGVGIVAIIIGILYQSYLISIRDGPHLTGAHSVAGLIATILLIPALVLWKRQINQKERGK
jgi:biotin transporter BioY